MMGEVNRQHIDELQKRLDAVWNLALKVMGTPLSSFDSSNMGRAQQEKQRQKTHAAHEMSLAVEELLKVPVYLGSKHSKELALELEEILVENIARITRLNADTGEHLKKVFLSYNRSGGAWLKIHLKSVLARINFWLQDGIRGA